MPFSRIRAVAISAIFVCAASVAQAGGGVVKLRTADAQEASGGTWRIFMSIALPHPPSMPHVPMKFVFTQQIRFERTLVDGAEGPQMMRVPVSVSTPIIEMVDVGFGDGRGKVFKDSRYDLLINRERGFEAGEWKLQVKDSDGREIGAPLSLVLKGDNDVVDRRSMVFGDKGSAKKKSREERAAAAAMNADGSGEEEVKASGPIPSFVDPAAHGKTAEEDLKVRKRGCACSVSPVESLGFGPWAACATLVSLSLIRRRRHPS